MNIKNSGGFTIKIATVFLVLRAQILRYNKYVRAVAYTADFR